MYIYIYIYIYLLYSIVQKYIYYIPFRGCIRHPYFIFGRQNIEKHLKTIAKINDLLLMPKLRIILGFILTPRVNLYRVIF